MRHAFNKGIDLRPEDLHPLTGQYACKQGIRDRTPAASNRFPRRWGGLQEPGPGYTGHPFLYELNENMDQLVFYISLHHVDDPVGRQATYTRMQDRTIASGAMAPPTGRARTRGVPCAPGLRHTVQMMDVLLVGLLLRRCLCWAGAW